MKISLSRFFELAAFIAGPALTMLGVPSAIVPFVIQGLQQAEQATHATSGAEKKAIALAAVCTGVSAVNAAKPGSVDPKAIDTVSSSIDDVISIINLIHSKGSVA